MKRIYWDKEAHPIDTNLIQALYEMRCEDGGNPLLLDAVTVEDIIDDADETVSMDALVTPFSKLERRMTVMQNVMNRTGTDVRVLAMQVTPPFKNRGVTNVATIFELSDGQTISVFFHNPDTTPNRLAPTDEMISWKWLLNKKDVTIAVAPEQGKDLNVHEVARRLMRLADRNSAAFARANKRRAERLQAIQTAKDEVAQLEEELVRIQKDIEAARIDLEDKQTKRDAEKAAYEARKAEKERIEAERKAKEEAERQAAEERARQEEEQRKAAEEEAKRLQEEELERQRNAQPQTPQDQTVPNDLDVATDMKTLQSIIDKTHPKISSPDLFSEIEALWNRYDGKNEQMMDLLNRAVDAWSEVANDLTKNVA